MDAISGRTKFRLSGVADDKTIVLVDVFDTVIFRDTHPLRLLETWAGRMIAIFSIDATPVELARIRRNSHLDLLVEHSEVGVAEILSEVFDRLVAAGMLDSSVDVDTFSAAGHELEVLLELSSQHPNNQLVNQLVEWKSSGKQLYCLSDHYLTHDDIQRFLEELGLSNLFEGVFVSSEFATSKRIGDLYSIVVDKLGVAPDRILMVGDNRVGDYRNAVKSGISATHIPNRRVRLRAKRQLLSSNTKLRARELSGFVRKSRKSDYPFSEYTVLFYVFIERLYAALRANNADCVVFFSREGYALKKLFDTYQEICIPPGQQIPSRYLKASRRSIQGLFLDSLDQEDFAVFGAANLQSLLRAVDIDVDGFHSNAVPETTEPNPTINEDPELFAFRKLANDPDFQRSYEKARTEAQVAFRALMDRLVGNSERLHLVDVGWKGTMQGGISRFLGTETRGYYIGVIVEGQNTNFNRMARATGLVFSNYPYESEYYHVLRANTQLLEQLLAAPHGSPVTYGFDPDGHPISKDDWVENERSLYEDVIEKHQAFSLGVFEEMCEKLRGNPDRAADNAILASLVTSAALFGTKRRLAFLDRLDEGFVANFNTETRGLRWDVREVDLGIREVLLSPERLLRYYAKLQRTLKRQRIPLVYKLVTPFYYAHLKLALWFKHRTGDSALFQGRSST